MEAMYATDNNYYPITLDLLRVPCNYNNDHHYKIQASNQKYVQVAQGHVSFQCKWRRANKKLETEI